MSKSDPTALGAHRTHRCACSETPNGSGAFSPLLCPVCVVHAQFRSLEAHFGARASEDAALPPFPTIAGCVVAKRDVVETIKHAASLLNLPLREPSGAERWGGHALRRGGAQYLGAAGVEIHRIQALARHSSNAIMSYVANSHLESIHNIAVEAALARDIQGARDELNSLRARTLRAGPLVQIPDPPAALPAAPSAAAAPTGPGAPPSPPPPPPPPPTHAWVVSTGRKKHIHRIKSGVRHVARCGWFFAATEGYVTLPSPRPSDPTLAAPLCQRCTAAPASSSSSSSPPSSPASTSSSEDGSSSD